MTQAELMAAGLMQPGERLDDLQRGWLRILQRPDGFCFGMDAVLLAAFASSRDEKGRAADLGTGTGILPLLCCARMPSVSFDAVEIQTHMADMARRSMLINGMQARVCVHEMDMREAPKALGYERFRLVVCNPPYGQAGGGMQNPDESRRLARHEAEADITLVCKTAGALLYNGGRFDVIFPAPRLLALMDAMRQARIEPKRIRLVHPKWGAEPNLALVEGIKAAKPLLQFLPPLYIRDAAGNETAELAQIYADKSSRE